MDDEGVQKGAAVDPSTLSLAERPMNKIRTVRSATDLGYLNLSFPLSTSNICEILFLKGGYALTNRREGILSSNFESYTYFTISTKTYGIF